MNWGPIVSYNMATGIMYTLSKRSGCRQYNKYTGWSRLQILCCLPWICKRDVSNLARDLIHLNSFGCAIAVHVFYLLSGYKVLNILASRSLKSYTLNQYLYDNMVIHLLADFMIHGTPAVLCYYYIVPSPSYTYREYVWMIPAISHVMYPYMLVRSWDPTGLYEIPIKFHYWKYVVGWMGTFCGYYVVSIVMNRT